MTVLVVRFIGLCLFVFLLDRLAKRGYESPVQHEGEFINSDPRIFRAILRIGLPLLSIGAILAVSGYALLQGPLTQTLGVESGLFSRLLQPVVFIEILILGWLPSLLLVFVWFWRMGLKPSIIILGILTILCVALIVVGGILLLEQLILVESPTQWLITWLGSLLSGITANLWVFPLSIMVVAPPLFLVYILRDWTIELFPIWKREGEDQPWSREERRLAGQYCIGFFSTLPKPATFVKSGEMVEQIKGNPFFGTGPGLVITEPENIVAIRDSEGFKRFVGPGAAFIGMKGPDVPYAVLDLQKQFRLARINAITRDGVEISVPCSSMFKIDAGNEKVKFGKPWPYRVRAAFQVLHAAREVNPTNTSILEDQAVTSWTELPLRTATSKLEQLVAGYTLDDLYATKRSSPVETLPRKEITKELRTYVREKMAKVGISVLGGGVGAALIPQDEEITNQRVDTWKAQWAEKLEVEEGKATGAYLREAERVRISILNELFQMARQLGESSVENKKALLAARLLEMLDNIARAPGMDRLLPEQVQSYYEFQKRYAADEQSSQGEE